MRSIAGTRTGSAHQNAIGLTADQQAAIRAEMQKMMARCTDLQWQETLLTSEQQSQLQDLARSGPRPRALRESKPNNGWRGV